MNKNLALISFIGMLTIVLGAFGAHALKEILNTEQLKSFETAVRYQMYHVIVLLFVSLYPDFSRRTKLIISYFFYAGILFFSGSIYAITIGGVSAKSIWFVTPLGGLFFILGWSKMCYSFIANRAH